MGAGAVAAASAAIFVRRLARAEETALQGTPSGDLGPFYPVEHPVDADSDLTRVGTGSGRARGELIEVTGRVLALDGTPQPLARIELWQANAAGRYAHPGDTRADAPLDPSFQGYADLRADAAGYFRFLTVRPGMYPVGSSFRRSPHIHLDVRGRQRRLVTQMYFDDTDARVLAQDKVLQHDLWGKSPVPATVFAKLRKEASRLDAAARLFQFDIVLS